MANLPYTVQPLSKEGLIELLLCFYKSIFFCSSLISTIPRIFALDIVLQFLAQLLNISSGSSILETVNNLCCSLLYPFLVSYSNVIKYVFTIMLVLIFFNIYSHIQLLHPFLQLRLTNYQTI